MEDVSLYSRVVMAFPSSVTAQIWWVVRVPCGQEEKGSVESWNLLFFFFFFLDNLKEDFAFEDDLLSQKNLKLLFIFVGQRRNWL